MYILYIYVYLCIYKYLQTVNIYTPGGNGIYIFIIISNIYKFIVYVANKEFFFILFVNTKD